MKYDKGDRLSWNLSAIAVAIVAVAAIAGLVYSARQHQDNIREEFLLLCIDKLCAREQGQV